MTTFALIGGGVAIIALLIWAYGKTKKNQGRLEEIERSGKEMHEDIELKNRIKKETRNMSRRDIIDRL